MPAPPRFTFHYGLIKTIVNAPQLEAYDNLHSTMVLLKLDFVFVSFVQKNNLHSTMVLLKQLVVSAPLSFAMLFTFHYGLIKTIY